MSPIGRHFTSEVFVRIFQYTGIWFPQETSYLYSCYTFVIYIFFVLLYAVFTIVHLFSIKTVDEATQALFMVTIVSQVFIKATLFLFFNRRIRKLLYRFHNDFELYNDTERSLVNARLRSFRNLLISFLTLCVICVSSGCITSAFKTKPELPFPTWHPLNWTTDKLSFWLAWCHISAATYLAIGSTPAVQMFAGSSVY